MRVGLRRKDTPFVVACTYCKSELIVNGLEVDAAEKWASNKTSPHDPLNLGYEAVQHNHKTGYCCPLCNERFYEPAEPVDLAAYLDNVSFCEDFFSVGQN